MRASFAMTISRQLKDILHMELYGHRVLTVL